MATLFNQPIDTTYQGLIKTIDNAEIPVSGRVQITDGLGNGSALELGQAEAMLYNPTLIGGNDTYIAADIANDKFVYSGGQDFSAATVTGLPVTGVQSIVAGTNVTVNNTDPANPIVSATGGGGGSDLAEGQAITPYLSSNIYSIPWILSGYGQTPGKNFGSANAVQLIPFYANAGQTIGEFYFRVETPQAGALMNVGLYKSYISTASGYKTTMPEFVATIASNVNISTSGLKLFTGLDITLPADAVGGCYWIGFQSSAANVNLTKWTNWVAAERVIYDEIYRGTGVEITRPSFTLPTGQVNLVTTGITPSTDLPLDFAWRYKS